jgi:nuclear transport factor 2 (NTF2) superfamily protein
VRAATARFPAFGGARIAVRFVHEWRDAASALASIASSGWRGVTVAAWRRWAFRARDR